MCISKVWRLVLSPGISPLLLVDPRDSASSKARNSPDVPSEIPPDETPCM